MLDVVDRSAPGARKPFPVSAPVLGAAAVFLICLALTLAGWWLARGQIEALAHERFKFHVTALTEDIESRMRSYEQVLRGGVGLFAATGDVTRQMWGDYVERLRIYASYPGIQGIGFAQIVSPEAVTEHERQIQAEGFSSYRITPPGTRNIYAPIVFLEPFRGRNLRAFGFDMLSEPNRRAAMLRARDDGDTIISGKVTLRQETGTNIQAGFLMYLPVYRTDLPTDSITRRQAALRGWVYSPFRMNDLMAGIFGRAESYIHLSIFDGDIVSDQTLLYSDHPSPPGNEEHAHDFSEQTTLYIGGHLWTLRLESTPVFEATIDRSMPRTVLVAGALIALLLAAIVCSLAQTRARAIQLAETARALTRARAEAEAANTAKTRFLAAASHDLRQPLQSMNLYLHILSAKLTTPEQRDLLAQVEDTLRATQGLFNSLMDISAMESGEVKPDIKPIVLADILDRIVAEAEPEARAKGLSLRTKFCGGTVESDPVLMERIVRNLVHNALRYTDKGGILIACRSGKGHQRIEIWDTGLGIPADKLELIFEDFYQLANPGQEREKGMGLGLATVARMARLLNCRIHVRSRLGRGTVFTIEVPAAPPPSDHAVSAAGITPPLSIPP